MTTELYNQIAARYGTPAANAAENYEASDGPLARDAYLDYLGGQPRVNVPTIHETSTWRELWNNFWGNPGESLLSYPATYWGAAAGDALKGGTDAFTKRAVSSVGVWLIVILALFAAFFYFGGGKAVRKTVENL